MVEWYRGVDKTIDTRKYTIVFLTPGNGFNSATIENYRDIARDIARILLKGYVYWRLIFYLLLLAVLLVGNCLGNFGFGA
jgi:hypothetical protein